MQPRLVPAPVMEPSDVFVYDDASMTGHEHPNRREIGNGRPCGER